MRTEADSNPQCDTKPPWEPHRLPVAVGRQTRRLTMQVGASVHAGRVKGRLVSDPTRSYLKSGSGLTVSFFVSTSFPSTVSVTLKTPAST